MRLDGPLVLLDQNVPKGLKHWCIEFAAATAFELGWHHLQNGDLIRTADEAGFRVLVTCDKNLRYQQNLMRRRISIVVLSTNQWPKIQESRRKIMEQVKRAVGGESLFVEVDINTERSPGKRTR